VINDSFKKGAHDALSIQGNQVKAILLRLTQLSNRSYLALATFESAIGATIESADAFARLRWSKFVQAKR
jgi:hypothetical protein